MKKSVTAGLIFASIVLPIEIRAQNIFFSQKATTQSSALKRAVPVTESRTEDEFRSVFKTDLEILDSDNKKDEREYQWSSHLREKDVMSAEDEARLGKKLLVLNTRDFVEENIKDTALEEVYEGVKQGIEGFRRITSLSVVENEAGNIQALAAHKETEANKSKTHFKVYLEPTMRDGVKVSAKTLKVLKLDYYPNKQKAMLVFGVDF